MVADIAGRSESEEEVGVSLRYLSNHSSGRAVKMGTLSRAGHAHSCCTEFPRRLHHHGVESLVGSFSCSFSLL